VLGFTPTLGQSGVATMLEIGVEHIEKNEGFYFYLYPFEDLVQRNFQKGFYVCIK
jgi:hypothetical protein